MDNYPVVPFRWDISRRHQLGRLVEGPPVGFFRGFKSHLRRCCAGVLALAGDADLFFVGRSPESAFDYLSGVLLDTSWSSRLNLLQFSMHYITQKEIHNDYPDAVRGLRPYLQLCNMSVSPRRK